MENYFTPEQLAERLGVTVGYLSNLRSAGKGPAFIKLSEGRGGAVRYPESAVLAWLESKGVKR